MKVLIVGGLSSIAVALKPQLSKFYDVDTAGRNQCDIHLDLTDSSEKFILPDNLDVIIHTAANFGGKSDKEIIEAENTNVIGTLKLCQAAVKFKIKHFIYISSIFANLKQDDENYSIYSLSKKHSEELATYYCSINNLPLTIIRPTHLYGLEASFRKHQPFFYSILSKAKNNEDIELYGINDPIRNYLFIEDLNTIITKVIQKRITGVYNCAQMKDVTYSEIANTAFNVFGAKGTIISLKEKPNVPSYKYDKDDSLYKKIDFYPQVNIEEGIRKISLNPKSLL